MGQISNKLKKKFSNKKKLVLFNEIREIASQSEQSSNTIKPPDRLKNYDPLHAIHITAQNLVSVFAEQISILPELKLYHKEVAKAEDLYIPGFPPISPITNSYFTMWAFYDYCFGDDRESIASILLDLSGILHLSAEWLQVIETQKRSCMGVHEHCGFFEDKILLKALLTGEERKCICPAGYRGEKGELWFARIVDAPFSWLDYSVVFTTPYLLRGHNKVQWLEYFERNGITEKDSDAQQKLQLFMKQGDAIFYWHDFIGNGYDGYRDNVIFLRGIPDMPITLPHGDLFDG